MRARGLGPLLRFKNVDGNVMRLRPKLSDRLSLSFKRNLAVSVSETAGKVQEYGEETTIFAFLQGDPERSCGLSQTRNAGRERVWLGPD